MFRFFITSKILLTIIASILIARSSPWLVPVFTLFIAIDLIDSKVMGEDYRPFDSFFDRLFAYSCFFAFMFFAESIYPAVIYIAAFVIRDYFLLLEIQKIEKYAIRSNILDRGTMLATAIFFALQAGGLIPSKDSVTEFFCYFIAFLIIHQGLNKTERIKQQAKLALN